MIRFTERAKEEFSLLLPAERPSGQVMRLDVVDDGHRGRGSAIALDYGEPERGDEAVRHAGEPLVWVSMRVSAAYDGCVVDVDGTPGGRMFHIGPPAAGRYGRG